MDEIRWNDSTREDKKPIAYTVRDLIAAVLRRRRLVLSCFAAVMLGVFLATLFMPSYQSNMKILVGRDRVDPVVSSDQSAAPVQIAAGTVTEEEMNSEAELLTSDDLLRNIAMTVGVAPTTAKDEKSIARAVYSIRKHLRVEPLRKTHIINVTYSGHDPQQAAQILRVLANSYIEKHTAVHRPAGEFNFFEQQAEQSQQRLATAESRLKKFGQGGAVAPQVERDETLQKLAEFNSVLHQTRAALRETQNRIYSLERLERSTPARLTTQVRRTDNPQLMQQLKSTLLTLELKRTELLTKFEPSYRPVQEVDQQIAETRQAIASEQAKPLSDETTDLNPTNQWVRSELAKARADVAGLTARDTAMQRIVTDYQSRERALNTAAIEQQDLLRSQKAEEERYLIYVRKKEEARISDALDQRRILNVALAQEPTVPALPARSTPMLLMLGIVMAAAISFGLVVVAELTDRTFHRPDQLASAFEVPVLAAIPQHQRSNDDPDVDASMLRISEA